MQQYNHNNLFVMKMITKSVKKASEVTFEVGGDTCECNSYIKKLQLHLEIISQFALQAIHLRAMQ